MLQNYCLQRSQVHFNDKYCKSVFENGFEKSKNFITYWLKAFSPDTPQSIRRQNKGPKEHDGNIYPVVDRNRPIRKMQAHV